MLSYLWNSSLSLPSGRCCSACIIRPLLPPRPALRRGRHFVHRPPRAGSSRRQALSARRWVHVSLSDWTRRLKRQHCRPIAAPGCRAGAGPRGARRRCRAGSGAGPAVTMAAAAAASPSDKER